MTWFKVDDGFHAHPKILGCTLAARGLWVTAGSYCAQQLTDGFVPDVLVRMHNGVKAARELVAAGLWVAVDGGWKFHEWSEYQPSRADVRDRRDAVNDRKRRSRAGHAPVTRDTPVTLDHAHALPDPTRPDPTQESPTAALRQRDRLIEALADLPTAFDLDLPGWAAVDAAVEAVGVDRLVEVARHRAGSNPPRSARAWITPWANLRAKPTVEPRPRCIVHDRPLRKDNTCIDCAIEAREETSL